MFVLYAAKFENYDYQVTLLYAHYEEPMTAIEDIQNSEPLYFFVV